MTTVTTENRPSWRLGCDVAHAQSVHSLWESFSHFLPSFLKIDKLLHAYASLFISVLVGLFSRSSFHHLNLKTLWFFERKRKSNKINGDAPLEVKLNVFCCPQVAFPYLPRLLQVPADMSKAAVILRSIAAIAISLIRKSGFLLCLLCREDTSRRKSFTHAREKVSFQVVVILSLFWIYFKRRATFISPILATRPGWEDSVQAIHLS